MMEKTIKELLKAIKSSDAKKTNPYDTSATVTRVENGVAYVHIPGGVDETPVKLTVNVQPGDEVQIRVGGGQAWITGNETAPPTDDRVANEVASNLSITNRIVKTVKAIAEAAATIAGNTAQFFWHTETGTDTGAHVTEIPQADFEADPTHGGGNLLLRSNGIAVRDGLTELATFAAGLIQMGESGGWTTKVKDTGFQIWDETTPSNPKLKMFLDASGLDFYEEVSGVNLSVAEITPLTGGGLAIKNLISHQEFRMNSAGAEIMNQYGHGMSLSGGDLSVTGALTASNIGTVHKTSGTAATTIAAWTWTTLCTLTLQPGTYLVHGYLHDGPANVTSLLRLVTYENDVQTQRQVALTGNTAFGANISVSGICAITAQQTIQLLVDNATAISNTQTPYQGEIVAVRIK